MTTYISSTHVDVEPEVAVDQVIELMTKSFTLLEATPERVGTKYRYEMRLLGQSIGGTCTLTEYVPGERVTFQWRGPERFTVGGLRGEWSFTPEDGGTGITVRSIFEPRVPVLHGLGARLMIGGAAERGDLWFLSLGGWGRRQAVWGSVVDPAVTG